MSKGYSGVYWLLELPSLVIPSPWFSVNVHFQVDFFFLWKAESTAFSSGGKFSLTGFFLSSD